MVFEILFCKYTNNKHLKFIVEYYLPIYSLNKLKIVIYNQCIRKFNPCSNSFITY